jgi:hypothetical protein
LLGLLEAFAAEVVVVFLGRSFGALDTFIFEVLVALAMMEWVYLAVDLWTSIFFS